MKKSAYLGWTIGSFTSSALVSAVGLLHLRFMTDSLGLAITLAGALTVAAKVYDAFADLLMGHVADRTRTRFGQFRPYLLAGGVLAALSMALLFNVPSLSGSALWLYVGLTLLIYSTAYTMFRIPYLAIGRSITDDFHARSRLMTFSVLGSSLGSFAATSAAPLLLGRIGSDRAGHGTVSLILAVAIALGGIGAFALLRENGAAPEPRAHRPSGSVKATVAAILGNRPFLCLMGFKVVLFTGLAVHISAIPYYTRHVLGVSDSVLGTIFAVQTAMMVISQPLWVRLAARFGRRNALMTSGIACTIAYLVWGLIPATAAIPMVFIGAGLSGLGTGGVFLGLYTVLTDTMDHARRIQGEDRAGMLAGVFVMVEKGTSALGTFAFSMVMAWVGFQSATGSGAAHQPAGVHTGIVTSVALIPALGAIVATLIITRYRLPAPAASAPEAEVVPA